MPRILVRGSVNIDVRLYPVASHEDSIVKPGETIASTSFTRSAGGKGANVAAAAARAGADVDLCGAVGRDGDVAVQALRSAGVGLDRLRTDEKTPTGCAIIQVDPDGENSIVILAGCNALHVELPPLEEYSVLVCQNEIPLEATAAALSASKSATTVFNPSPMLSKDEWLRLPLASIYWLVVNSHEADQVQRTFGHSLADLRSVFTTLRGVVVTRGPDGVETTMWTSEDVETFSVPTIKPPKPIVDTTGAGDCFLGYFAASLARGLNTPDDVRQATRLAAAAATLSITRAGAMSSYPPRREVEAVV